MPSADPDPATESHLTKTRSYLLVLEPLPGLRLCEQRYSDGAFVCVQKSVALICRSDGGRFNWSIVTDKDLADRCSLPHPMSVGITRGSGRPIACITGIS